MGGVRESGAFVCHGAAFLCSPRHVTGDRVESGGLRYYALTRNGLTVMVAQLPAQVRDYNVLQVAVSNGGDKAATVRPEDFVFIREDGTEVQAMAPRTVVKSR